MLGPVAAVGQEMICWTQTSRPRYGQETEITLPQTLGSGTISELWLRIPQVLPAPHRLHQKVHRKVPRLLQARHRVLRKVPHHLPLHRLRLPRRYLPVHLQAHLQVHQKARARQRLHHPVHHLRLVKVHRLLQARHLVPHPQHRKALHPQPPRQLRHLLVPVLLHHQV